MCNQLKVWCEKYNALQRTVDSFWEHFYEYKNKNKDIFEELNITKEKEKKIFVFYEKAYYIVSFTDNKTYIAIEVYIQCEEEDIGMYKVFYNETDGVETAYEIW